MYDLRAILKRLKFPISTTLAGSEKKKIYLRAHWEAIRGISTKKCFDITMKLRKLWTPEIFFDIFFFQLTKKYT